MNQTSFAPKMSSLIVILLAAFTLSNQALAAGYTITDLGTLGGSSSYASAINDNGQVVGRASTTGDTATHAYLYSNGTMFDLGTLGGDYSAASDINNNGQVVGGSVNINGNYNAFSYANGTMNNIYNVDSTYGTYATGINNNGQIVGGGYDSWKYGVDWAFIDNSGIKSFPLGSTTGYATAINDNNQVVGDILDWAWLDHGFVYTNGTITSLGYLNSASDINNKGEVVGVTSYTSAFLYSNGQMINLGSLGNSWTSAYALNEKGQVVGSSDINSTSHAFLYSGGAMLDLNTLLAANSGWELLSASDINELGQIVGTGTINGQTHAYLLTPTTVPVPAAAWLLGSGLLGLAGMARRKAA